MATRRLFGGLTFAVLLGASIVAPGSLIADAARLRGGADHRATTRLGAYTPLYLAARGGHSGVVAALLAAGADANAVTSNGTTPLMIAAAAGDTKTITALVENGSDVNARDTVKGETPL